MVSPRDESRESHDVSPPWSRSCGFTDGALRDVRAPQGLAQVSRTNAPTQPLKAFGHKCEKNGFAPTFAWLAKV